MRDFNVIFSLFQVSTRDTLMMPAESFLGKWDTAEDLISRFGRSWDGFEPWSNQTNDLQMYACRFLGRGLALLG